MCNFKCSLARGFFLSTCYWGVFATRSSIGNIELKIQPQLLSRLGMCDFFLVFPSNSFIFQVLGKGKNCLFCMSKCRLCTVILF